MTDNELTNEEVDRQSKGIWLCVAVFVFFLCIFGPWAPVMWVVCGLPGTRWTMELLGLREIGDK